MSKERKCEFVRLGGYPCDLTYPAWLAAQKKGGFEEGLASMCPTCRAKVKP